MNFRTVRRVVRRIDSPPRLVVSAALIAALMLTLNGGDRGAASPFSPGVDLPPTAACIESTNPAGENVSPSGPNAGKSGQNPDGFYQLQASDDDGIASIVVRDSGSTFVSDAFASGDRVKITQSPGAKPSDSRPGPGVIASQLKLNGDAVVQVTDTAGQVTAATCRVAPLPK